MAAHALRSSVISGYRRLLRARCVAFQGDELALNKSREALRQAFEDSRGESDKEKIGKAQVVLLLWQSTPVGDSLEKNATPFSVNCFKRI